MGLGARDVHYSPDQYGNPEDGFRFYMESSKVQVLAASQEVYFTKVLIDNHMAKLQHAMLQKGPKNRFLDKNCNFGPLINFEGVVFSFSFIDPIGQNMVGKSSKWVGRT